MLLRRDDPGGARGAGPVPPHFPSSSRADWRRGEVRRMRMAGDSEVEVSEPRELESEVSEPRESESREPEVREPGKVRAAGAM